MIYFRLFLITMALLLTSCIDNEESLGSAMLKADTIDETIMYSKKLETFKEAALPVYIEIINILIVDEHKLNNYGKINVCLDSLLNLAKKGIHSKDETIALLNIIEKQRFINDTLKTAKILETITGIDVGYNENFVKKYSSESEDSRTKMLKSWREYLDGQ